MAKLPFPQAYTTQVLIRSAAGTVDGEDVPDGVWFEQLIRFSDGDERHFGAVVSRRQAQELLFAIHAVCEQHRADGWQVSEQVEGVDVLQEA